MITRISEASVKPSEREAFLERLRDLVRGFPAQYDGLLSHEILLDLHDASRVSYLSRWRDEESLVNYAGVNWAVDPVTFPDEERYLDAPLTLRHFLTETP